MRQCWGTVSTGMWRCKSGDCTGLQLLKRQVVPVDDFYLLISELDFWKKSDEDDLSETQKLRQE